MNNQENQESQQSDKIIEETKKDIKEKVKKAKEDKSGEEIDKLKKELKEEIEKLKEKAQEFVDDDIESRLQNKPLSSKEQQKKDCYISFIKIIEAIKAGIPAEEITPNKNGAIILDIIAKKQIITESTVPYIITYFGDYIFGEKEIYNQTSGKINSDFKDRFEELKLLNLFAAKKIRESILEAVETRKFIGLKSKEIKEELNLSNQDKSNKIEEEEKKEHQKLFLEINEKIEELIKNKEISYEEISKINDFLFTGEIDNEINNALNKIKIEAEKIQRYSELTKLIKNDSLQFGILESYSPAWIEYVREAKKEFSLEELKKYFERDNQGKIFLSTENRKILKDKIRKYYYIALKDIHAQPSIIFHKVLGEHQDINYYLIMLRQVVSSSFEKIKEIIPEEQQDIIDFLKDVSTNYQSRIISQAEMFHDVPLYVRDLGTIEKILDFLKFIFPTQIAELFDDDKVYLTIARDELVMALREYLVERNNQYDGSLISGEYNQKGVYWNQWFKDKYLKRLKNRLRNTLISKEEREYLEENMWKIEMLSTYAESIGLMTLIDGEILATSDPVPHFRNIHPLMSFLSAKHNWSTGRGRDAPGLINKYLLGMRVDLYPTEKSFLKRLFSKKKFDPQEIVKEIDNLIDIKGGNLLDNIYNASALYYQLMSMFNLPNSYNSWDGWRIQEVPKEFNNIVKKLLGEEMDIFSNGKNFNSEKWQKVFDLGLKLYGTSFLWWSIKGDLGRLRNEIDGRLRNLGFSDEMIKNIKQKNAIEKIIKINISGQERKINYVEFEELKLSQRRGELFFRYMRKNPGDFLLIMHQLCQEAFSYDDKKDWQNTFLFRFDPGLNEKEIIKQLIKEGKTKDEINKFIKKRKNFLERWKGSFDELKNFNIWIKKISNDKYFFNDKNEFDKNIFINIFLEKSSNAYFRLKKENEEYRKKILYSDLSIEEKKSLLENLRDYLTENDFKDDEKHIWEIISGENGLFESLTKKQFNNINEYFSEFGGVNSEGNINIFFNMAHNWFINNGDINPFSADTPYFEVFKNFKNTGEDTLKRTFEANIATFKEVVSKLSQLEKILINASSSGSLEEIKKLHEGIYSTLSGLVGNEYAWKANYILAQIVGNFFVENSILRDPKLNWLGPIGSLIKYSLSKNNISLSKILTKNMYAYSMDNNALRTYFEFLSNNNLINPENNGPWSLNQLNTVYETKNIDFIFGDVTPKILWSITTIIFLIYLKKSIEETFEKKK